MSPTKKSRRPRGNVRSILSVVIGVALSGAALFIWMNRQYVLDWVSFHEYTPTPAVARIAERTTMTDTGRFYLYASKPAVLDAATFNTSCTSKESSTAILGCYANNRVFVYDVTNEQLDGIKEVTAAHETLHAIYQRMSTSERNKVDDLIDKEYATLKDDKALATRMEFYARNEPGERDNELHSILGTEYGNLSPELEQHYAVYFKNRDALVALHTKYASVFDELQKKSDTLLAQLKTLGPEIETESDDYNAAVKQLNSDIQAFNTKATSGGFTSQTSFTAERARLVARADALDAQRSQINQKVTTYETARQEYNATAASSNELYKSINSKLAPSPSV